jgi:PAS domain-containing protein
MGDRVTQSRQAGEILRAKFLKQALERGTAPTLLPPGSALAWNQTESPENRAHYLEQLFQSMPDALSIVDSERRVQSVNDAFGRMFGYADWEVLGERLDSLVVPSER